MQFRSVLMVSLSSYLLLKNYLEDQTKVRAPLCKALYTHDETVPVLKPLSWIDKTEKRWEWGIDTRRGEMPCPRSLSWSLIEPGIESKSPASQCSNLSTRLDYCF